MEDRVWRAAGALAVGLSLVSTGWAQEPEEKLAARLEKIDQKFAAALGELAAHYDKAADAEAAHWLAACATWLGGKDPEVLRIKSAWELDLFVGKVRGGEALKDRNPIDTALRASAYEYKKIVDNLALEGRRKGLEERRRKLLQDAVIRQELARGAADYIEAEKRINALRRAMGLRAVLWDAEQSPRLILAAWYAGETGDWDYREVERDSMFYSPALETAKSQTTRLSRTLGAVPDILRSLAAARLDLFNPNARRLWLAHWGGGKLIDGVTIYAIPQLPYREDIPTPSDKYRGATVTKDWVDTEDTLEIAGRKIPFVRYPYPDEPDAPRAFAHGHEGMESSWNKSEHEYLLKGGVPIVLRIFGEDLSLTEVQCALTDRSGGNIPCRTYLNGDRRAPLESRWPTILLVPERPLDPATTYSVRIRCKLAGSPVEKSWTFTTRSK